MAKDFSQKREYIKVLPTLKKQLIELVFQKGSKIKEASNILGIKYAAAKTIILQFRAQIRSKHNKYSQDKPCLTRTIKKEKQNITIISQVGGTTVNKTTHLIS